MPEAIELRFDEKTEGRLRDCWRTAADYYGTSYLFDHGVIPHLALLVAEQGLDRIFAELPQPAMIITLKGVSFFAAGQVAYLEVDENPDLRAYHAACVRLADRYGVTIDPYYTPLAWVPHCTIAMGCTRNHELPLPFAKMQARIRSLLYIKYPPTVIISEREITHPVAESNRL